MKNIYVNENEQATIICPKCGLNKKIDATKFKGTHNRIKAKCRCGEIFRFTLEYRKHYRKKVRLPGEYFVQGKDERGDIIIEDISATGVRFASVKQHYISRNDIVELKFILDDSKKTQIRKLVKIKWIIDRSVGAEYIDLKSFEKDLGFYLKA
jgi:PilZ domain